MANEFNVEQAANVVLQIFGVMNKEQRQALVKILRGMKPRLDLNYPNGIPQEKPKESGLILPSKPGAGTEIIH